MASKQKIKELVSQNPECPLQIPQSPEEAGIEGEQDLQTEKFMRYCSLIQECWRKDPDERSGMDEVIEELNKIIQDEIFKGKKMERNMRME